ncbi:MAG: type II toxin-antitoxin system VapC family toxin [Verrucomicrobia bacterium]|nr:type II toxin-antitoxin system VapC family toxin [Verrucomicrobiota bacterium]
MIFVDSNIPMYLVGAAHPHKTDAQHLLERAVTDGQRLVSDAEVLQEILHRYRAISRSDAIQPAFDALLGVVDEIYPIEERDVLAAKDIVLGSRSLSSRDALHIAIMRRHGIRQILSFDQGYDGTPGLSRLG